MSDYKITKVELNSENGWKAFNNLRNDDGVLRALQDTAESLGEEVAAYKGLARSRVIVKMDKDTYDSLVASGKITPKDNDYEK